MHLTVHSFLSPGFFFFFQGCGPTSSMEGGARWNDVLPLRRALTCRALVFIHATGTSSFEEFLAGPRPW